MPITLAASTPPRSSFALTGSSVALDPRINAVRRDIADLRLAAVVFAPHYAAALVCTASRAAAIYPSADASATAVSEVRPGDVFELFEIARSFGWGRCCGDNSVGFVDRDALDVGAGPALGQKPAEGDFVDGAESMIGVPWKAGGRSPDGIDAAGLVFFAFQQTHVVVPRFADLQAELGDEVAKDVALQRGDLLFFADHVVVMTDAQRAVHVVPDAAVMRESLTDILRRCGPVIARRRVA